MDIELMNEFPEVMSFSYSNTLLNFLNYFSY